MKPDGALLPELRAGFSYIGTGFQRFNDKITQHTMRLHTSVHVFPETRRYLPSRHSSGL